MSRRVVIYGGKGALGAAVTAAFRRKNYWICSVDGSQNELSAENIIIDFSKDLVSQHDDVVEKLTTILKGEKLDAVICVAGGWAGGSARNADFVKNCDLMLKQSAWTSIIAASLSAKFLKEGAFCAFTGAQACLEPTPGMIGYGMAKASVHHLVSSLADAKGGLPAKATAHAILPVTLDTPLNRKWMAKADFSSWTPLEFVANLFVSWAAEPETRPANGSLVQLFTEQGVTRQVIA